MLCRNPGNSGDSVYIDTLTLSLFLFRRGWKYTRDGILCYVLFGSDPRKVAFIKGLVDERVYVCVRAHCTSIGSQSRRARAKHVSRSLSSIPPTHLEATRLRDSLPSRDGSSLIITGILMASANGFTRESLVAGWRIPRASELSTTLRPVFFSFSPSRRGNKANGE